jgi:hypothetical protein
LTLTTDSPVWSSRLRFFAPELERRLAEHRIRISSCRIRVQPVTESPRPGPGLPRRFTLSNRTEKHLVETAEAMEDEGLAAALRRIAKAGAARG